MKRKKLTIGAFVVLAAAGTGGWLARDAEADSASPYRLGEAEIGSVESTVSATGRITAVQSVAVGTQVSGQVVELFADYNDRVSRGQLIARIDPTLQQQALRNAEANLQRVQAALVQAQRDFDRNRTLYEQQIITEAEFNQVEYSLTVARANLTSAQVAREQAARNLSYTEIYSPIDGVVVERNVEPGQTVAASMSAPQLFLLATDLARVEILASVDESDIGSIRNGMPVRFTVAAYPNDRFEGEVRQVRLSSATQENVVSYTAVISVDNADLRLVPGMTAEVDFILEQAENVTLVPNTALRFRPTEEMIAQLTDSAMIAIATGTGGRGAARAAGPAARPAAGAAVRPSGERPTRAADAAAAAAPLPASDVFVLGGATTPAPGARGSFGTLWYLKDGKLGVLRVRTGISDGTNTQVQAGGLEEGMQLILGVNDPEEEKSGASTNPFQQQQAPMQRGPGGGMGSGFGG